MTIQTDRETLEAQGGRKVHPPARDITELVTFRLARLVAVNDKAGNRWMKSRYGISINEWRVLGLTHTYGPVRTGLIGDVLLMDKGQLSRLVRNLVERGLLESLPAKDDARSVELVLSDEGKTVHAEILEFAAGRNEVVVASLSPAEFDQFSQLLQKMISHNEDLMDLAELV